MKQEYESWFDADECQNLGFEKIVNPSPAFFESPVTHFWSLRINRRVLIDYTPFTGKWRVIFVGDDGSIEVIMLLIESKADAVNAILFFKNLLH